MTSKRPSSGYVEAWEIESLTEPGTAYTVSKRAEGTYACSCPRWKFHPKPKPDCKHIAALLREIDGTAPAQMADIAAELNRALPKNIRVSVQVDAYRTITPPVPILTKDGRRKLEQAYAESQTRKLAELDGLERFTVRRKFKLTD